MIDRFDSNEDVKWHEYAYEQGHEARRMDFSMLSQNPYKDNYLQGQTWLWRSFNAGWADMDMELLTMEAK